MNNITYDSKNYIFNNTTELSYPIYKIEFINNNEKIILIHSTTEEKSNTSIIVKPPKFHIPINKINI